MFTAQSIKPSLRKSRRVFVGAVQALFVFVPLPKRIKLALKTHIFKYCSPAFRDTEPYNRWKISSWYFLPMVNNSQGETSPLAFQACSEPLVSIIIPVQDNWKNMHLCLSSIKRHEPRASFEIIVVDDCSDGNPEPIAKIDGVHYLRNGTHRGFASSCNYGAAKSRGKYLMILKNCSQVIPGWLDELVWTLESVPDAGLVGSKLISPNGEIIEAGGIVWESGTTSNYGRFGDPAKPEFNYLRDVDFVSSASMLVSADLFHAVGDYRSNYNQGNYEDTELSFKIRERGRRVLYQPLSVVVVNECGEGMAQASQYEPPNQQSNEAEFCQRWSKVLSACPSKTTPVNLAKDWQYKKRALVIDQWTPRIDRDSGSIDTIQLFKLLQRAGFKPTFITSENSHEHDGEYTEFIQRSGTECLYAPYISSVAEHLREFGKFYDLVVLSRPTVAAKHLQDVRNYCGSAKIIFNTVDLHFVREGREAALNKDISLLEQAAKTKEIEFGLMQAADLTIVVSPAEEQLLAKEGPPGITVKCLPLTREIPGRQNSFEHRRDIFFVGFFGHAPNVDAIVYFTSEIWPLVRARLPDVRLFIIGSGDFEQTAAFKQPGIEIIGYVRDLDQYFNNCRMTVAPLRFGAGSKGKVVSSMCHGLPIVGTSIATEGLECESGVHIMVADSSESFAEAIVQLYSDQALWEKISDNSLILAKKLFSFEAVQKIFLEILNILGL